MYVTKEIVLPPSLAGPSGFDSMLTYASVQIVQWITTITAYGFAGACRSQSLVIRMACSKNFGQDTWLIASIVSGLPTNFELIMYRSLSPRKVSDFGFRKLPVFISAEKEYAEPGRPVDPGEE
ncbi:hypothetical protein PoB_001877200 [Plakobranchus ocellatus]|uniref:Uncharacterized protein n=1 Tax=Plakobranchus ocellatus TaxID=259542 RepID=A0AAV3ZAJ5_9GAST|nr:hypothetical protein PoB_001877200 [Plakobranchus ocellatus]